MVVPDFGWRIQWTCHKRRKDQSEAKSQSWKPQLSAAIQPDEKFLDDSKNIIVLCTIKKLLIPLKLIQSICLQISALKNREFEIPMELLEKLPLEIYQPDNVK